MTEYGIVVGVRDRSGVEAAFRRAGHALRAVDQARGEFAPTGRHARGRLRIHDDADHLTFRELCPFPHTIVETEGCPALAGTMRAIVANRGGYLRDAARAVSPAPTPEGDNPDFDLLRRLDGIEGLDHRARRSIALLSASDPDAFRSLAEALSERAAGTPRPPGP